MTATELEISTGSTQETERLGKALARLAPHGAVIALRGDLATGKTCLVRGMASELAGGTPIHSPTFTLVNEYGPNPKLYHLDLYRLAPDEIADLGYEELFDGDGICVVEWAERAEAVLPRKRLDIFLSHEGQDNRRLRFVDNGLMPADWQQILQKAFASPVE